MVQYPTVSGGQVTYTTASGQTVSVYAPGSSAAQATGTSSTAAVSIPSSGSLPGNCNTQWFIDTGDQSTYFLAGQTFQIGGGNQTRSVNLHVLRYSAPTVQAANVNQPGNLGTQATFYGASNTMGTQTAYVAVKAGTYNSSDNAPMEVFVTFNSLAIPQGNINFDGLSASGCPSSVTYITSNTGGNSGLVNLGVQNACLMYKLPEIHYNQYSTGTGGTQGAYLLPLSFTPGTGYVSTNELIGIELVPATGYYNTTTTVAKFQWPVYQNSQGQNLISAVVSGNLIVVRPD